MTNGEKIKEIFPNSHIDERSHTVFVGYEAMSFRRDWWNAEYKEPTTRNCFGCKYSKDNHNAGTEECHLCMWENQYTPTTKNDLGVDAISRADAIKAMQDKAKKLTNEDTINGLCGAVAILFDMPPASPQEPQTFEWCDTCKEYDQENHCCHRWSKVIRDTVEDMKQESKSEWQHDHEILKAHSDGANEVLGNIRAEIERQEKWLMDAGYNQYNVDIALDAIKLTVDKYTAESAHDAAQEIVKNNGVVDL